MLTRTLKTTIVATLLVLSTAVLAAPGASASECDSNDVCTGPEEPICPDLGLASACIEEFCSAKIEPDHKICHATVTSIDVAEPFVTPCDPDNPPEGTVLILFSQNREGICVGFR